jgi:hypothetical protein
VFFLCVIIFILHFLVHSVVAKLVVSKNCPKLVHKYLQNYSKTQYHWNWNWNCVKKLPEIILVTKSHNHIEVEGTSWKKIEIKVWGKINLYIDPGFTRMYYFYSMIQDDPNAANIRNKQEPLRFRGCFLSSTNTSLKFRASLLNSSFYKINKIH